MQVAPIILTKPPYVKGQVIKVGTDPVADMVIGYRANTKPPTWKDKQDQFQIGGNCFTQVNNNDNTFDVVINTPGFWCVVSSDAEEPEPMHTQSVNSDFFEVLDVAPALTPEPTPTPTPTINAPVINGFGGYTGNNSIAQIAFQDIANVPKMEIFLDDKLLVIKENATITDARVQGSFWGAIQMPLVAGAYKARVQDTNGNYSDFSAIANVQQNPIELLIIDKYALNVGENVTGKYTGTGNLGIKLNSASGGDVVTLNQDQTFSFPMVAKGTYNMLILNNSGSMSADIVVSPCPTPVISKQPTFAGITAGDPFSFSIEDDGTSRQWYLGGKPIVGETEKTFSRSTSSETDAGNYSCIVKNDCGSEIESDSVALTVKAKVVQKPAAPTGITPTSYTVGDTITIPSPVAGILHIYNNGVEIGKGSPCIAGNNTYKLDTVSTNITFKIETSAGGLSDASLPVMVNAKASSTGGLLIYFPASDTTITGTTIPQDTDSGSASPIVLILLVLLVLLLIFYYTKGKFIYL